MRLVRIYLATLMTLCCTAVAAQDDIYKIGVAEPEGSAAADSLRQPVAYDAETDMLHLPEMNSYGQVRPLNMFPVYCGGWHTWDLHSGLNMSIGASVFAQFGDGSYSGTGFTQNVSAMYAVPLSPKLSLAIGGYFSNVYWARDNYHTAGLTAVLGYQFDEHWETFIYGQKSLASSRVMPYSLYDINQAGDRIGAAVRYNFNPNFSIHLSVECNSLPRRDMFLSEQEFPRQSR